MRVKRMTIGLFVLILTVTASGCGQAYTEQQQLQQQQLQQQQYEYETQPPEVPIPESPVAPSEENVENETKTVRHKKQIKAKGIYVSAPIAASSEKLDQLINLLNRTELNAMVIDIKNDWGAVTYDSSAQKSVSSKSEADRHVLIKDMSRLVEKLKSHNIYLIGRVVAFKDPWLARARPDLAMKHKSGGTWTDRSGTAWVDPYMEQARAYSIDIAKEAALLGFDEIQFDYVRFPDGASVDRQVAFHNEAKQSKSDLIKQFVQDAEEQLSPLGVNVSADVFGLTTTVEDDMGIGQMWSKLANEVDYISPMVYPSHYSTGMYGFQNPDMHPYGVVKRALEDAVEKQAKSQIRPWLQCFTASWLKPHLRYGAQHVQEQIRAASELGIDQYLLWNPRCQYEAYVSP